MPGEGFWFYHTHTPHSLGHWAQTRPLALLKTCRGAPISPNSRAPTALTQASERSLLIPSTCRGGLTWGLTPTFLFLCS